MPKLPGKADKAYWDRVRDWAKTADDPGCSGVKDIYVICCFEHDIHYRTHKTLDGAPMTRAETDRRFRQCVQMHSKLGRFSPISWIRWIGVRAAGWHAW